MTRMERVLGVNNGEYNKQLLEDHHCPGEFINGEPMEGKEGCIGSETIWQCKVCWRGELKE